MLTASPRLDRSTSRGLSLIELMVGLAVSLVVVGGALTMMVRIQTTTWRLMNETRLNQDLRAAADLMARDLRRSGYWGNAIQGVLAQGVSSVALKNPYRALSGSTANGLSYGFSRDAVENDTLDSAEQFGFRLRNGVLQMQTASGVWTDLTDDKNLLVTALAVTPTLTALQIGNLCSKPCAAGTPNCPVSTVRSLAISLTGQAVRDSSVVRSTASTVRVRTDEFSGQCPT